MKVLILGKGIANDGVALLLNEEGVEYDYLEPQEVTSTQYEYVVKAPGIPYSHEVIKHLLAAHRRIITDIELVMLLRPRYYICVTGSNGKTTVVTLITKILSTKYSVVSCGNIGYSVCRAVVEHPNAQIFVVELSSFQLENSIIDPHISVLLNIRPCHLDHHLNFNDYLDAKGRITIHQSREHILVYPFNDTYIKKICSQSNAKKIAFSMDSYLPQCYIDRDWLCYEERRIFKLKEDHKNKEFLIFDMMAAICATMQVKGMTPRRVRKGISHFKEVSFRMEKLNDYIYNDAKSTNPYSTIAAIKCFDKVSLICGGYDRKENLNCLNEYLPKIKKVYAYGATKDKVYDYMMSHKVEVMSFDRLDDAFIQAIRDRNEEVILFSPMFASFDEFKNYIERGNYFNELFHKIFI